MAQSEDLQEDFHQAPALDGCATADVHALQKSLSDQQALTKQAESKLFEQENLTQQAQKAFLGRKIVPSRPKRALKNRKPLLSSWNGVSLT